MKLYDSEQIIFRQINDNLPRYWQPGENWFVEYHARDSGYPLGMAVVHVPPAGCDRPDPIMNYLFVCDHVRRRGIGSRIIVACEERWPGIEMSSVTDAGNDLLVSLGIEEPGDRKLFQIESPA